VYWLHSTSVPGFCPLASAPRRHCVCPVSHCNKYTSCELIIIIPCPFNRRTPPLFFYRCLCSGVVRRRQEGAEYTVKVFQLTSPINKAEIREAAACMHSFVRRVITIVYNLRGSVLFGDFKTLYVPPPFTIKNCISSTHCTFPYDSQNKYRLFP
jgi:hypothetical protein